MTDVYDLWEIHDAQMDTELSQHPICDCCGEYITGDYIFVDINGYDRICEQCLIDNYRREAIL